MSEPLLAYVVRGYENSVVRFAKSNVVARREGADELEEGFEEVESCNRAPQFDQYAPGPVPVKALIEDGWWYGCAGCSQRVDNDSCDDDDEPLNPVYPENGLSVYCSQDCYDADQKLRAEIRERREAAKAEALEKFPGITIDYVADGSDPAAVMFKVPGGKYNIRWEIGANTVGVPPIEDENWDRFKASLKRSAPASHPQQKERT